VSGKFSIYRAGRNHAHPDIMDAQLLANEKLRPFKPHLLAA
jgi:hypothetical protein